MSEKVIDLFDMESDSGLGFLDRKATNADGIYRPNLKDAKDKNVGYSSTIRFLPNLLEDGTLGLAAIEKHVHYAKFPDYPDLKGYYDSLVNFGEKCPLTTMYWQLKNSKNQAEVERADLISRTTKYYSYILVIEDEQHPEWEGKIMIYPYGFKIKEKIKNERNGENAEGKKCNVFDPANGKDFRLIIKSQGEWSSYESSIFRTVSPLKIWDAENSRFIEVPTEWDETKEKFMIKSAKVQQKVMASLANKDVVLEDNAAKPWTEEQKVKVNKIIDILSGKDISDAKNSINNESTNNESLSSTSLDDESDDLEGFFDDED